MRIDDPIFSGSVVGSDATVSLSGSFTGSGTIENANTASKLAFSASFGLGIVNTFDYDGSTNQTVTLDTASAHFITGALQVINENSGSYITTASISGLTQSFTKGDGTTFEVNLPDTGSVDLAFEITGGLGVDPFTFDNTANAQVQVNTSSFHIANLTASLIQTASVTDATMSFTKGDNSTFDVIIVSASQAGNGVSSIFMTSQSQFILETQNGNGLQIQIISASTAVKANAVTASLTGGLGIIPFHYSGGTDAAVILDTSSNHFVVGVSESIADLFTGSTTLSNAEISGSFTGSMTGNLTGTASFASKVEFPLTGALGVDAFTYDGSARAQVQVDTSSNHFVVGVSESIANLFTGSTTLSNAEISGSFTGSMTGNLTGTASLASKVDNELTGGLGIVAFTYDGSSDQQVVLDTSSAHFTTGVSASQASTLTTLSASLATSGNTTSASLAALSASASTAREAISSSLTTTDQAISASLAILSGSAITNVETSSARQVDTLTITRGNGTTFDVTHDTSSFVKSVNGNNPNAATGNVAVALASVETGLSASIPASADDGDVWIVSGETGGNTGSNGQAFIYSTASSQWFEISNLDQVENDARYVNLFGDTMTGALILSQNPTNVLGAATKQYVDPSFTTASVSTGSDGSHVLTFTRLGGGTDAVTLTSASYAIRASRVTASLSQGLGIETFTYDGGAARQVQLDTSSAHFTIGVSQSLGGQVQIVTGSFTGSFAGVLAGTASRVEFPLTNGNGVDTLSYDGASAETVSINTSSAHFVAGVSKSLGNGNISVGNLEVSRDIEITPDSRLSSSTEARNYVEVHDTAIGTGAAEISAIDAIQFVSNADSGSAGDIIFASNEAGTAATEILRVINANATTNKGLVWAQNNMSASNFYGTSSISAGTLSQGYAVQAFSYDGSQNATISVDTASQAFADGVARAMTSASFAGLTLNFEGATLTGNATSSLNANALSGSFSGSYEGDGSGLTGISATARYNTNVVTANTTMANNNLYVLTGSTALTMSLPATPTAGDSVKLSILNGVTNLVARGGSNIMSLSEDMAIDIYKTSFELVYTTAAVGWVVIGAGRDNSA